MKLFNCLSKKTQAALREIGECWRLEEGKKHIRIFVNDSLAAAAPKNVRGDGEGDRRAELNVVSQIRRAARGAASSRRTSITSAT
ncbi:hypothetical protein HJA82_29590 [Rhizobium bangladeshense]|uniref:hypothetical protein n=1 Tax=Rhizobium TaxID=379 RepID=UPI001C828E7E|nr:MULTISPECIES: hypothetical protein [Rhizobium]MBX4911470.1 hypothetical protein [Rhizobium bangladeshense]MBX5130758.1 hypothetical protein [Rhizobium lentis]